ncbi:hypothetical protein KBB68_00990 [Candidatus Babeliales bacterium]|nr:hypothetical protein [Candidatus Babeliales bacterium]
MQDLFIKRFQSDEHWTLFSPEETPELHELYGQVFEEAIRIDTFIYCV